MRQSLPKRSNFNEALKWKKAPIKVPFFKTDPDTTYDPPCASTAYAYAAGERSISSGQSPRTRNINRIDDAVNLIFNIVTSYSFATLGTSVVNISRTDDANANHLEVDGNMVCNLLSYFIQGRPHGSQLALYRPIDPMCIDIKQL